MPTCEVKRCRRDSEPGLIYLSHEVCLFHWLRFCEERKPDLRLEETYKKVRTK